MKKEGDKRMNYGKIDFNEWMFRKAHNQAINELNLFLREHNCISIEDFKRRNPKGLWVNLDLDNYIYKRTIEIYKYQCEIMYNMIINLENQDEFLKCLHERKKK